MTDHDLEQRLRDWYGARIDPAEPAPGALRAQLSAIPDVTALRPRPVLGRWAVLLAAAVVAVALLAAGIAIGMRLVVVPAPLPVPPPAPTTAPPAVVVPSESPIPSETPRRMRDLVAYGVETRLPDAECVRSGGILRCVTIRLWVANMDGSNAVPLLPDWRARQQLVGWSSDGTVLYFISTSLNSTPPATNLWAMDADGQGLRMIDTGELCRDVCGTRCDFMCGELSLSPDGTQIALARFSEDESVIAVLDLETGDVREIEATRVGPFPDSVAQPRWSPDGKTLVFARSAAPNAERCFRPEAGALVTIRPDGSGMREIAPLETCAWDARWSRDGTSLVFSSDGQFITEEVDGRYSHELHDVFTVHVDGTDLRQLTTDQISTHASWTTDGHIAYARIPLGDLSTDGLNTPQGFELWVMDADGANARQLDASDLGELSEAGCRACPYPLPDLGGFFGTLIALWQPETP